MKQMKKMMALLIAAVMVLAMAVPALADPGDLTPDATITIEGLDSGDTVHLYQVLEWKESVGWVLAGATDSQASPYAALTTSGDDNFCQAVKDLIDNKPNVSLDKADLEKIANVVKAANNAVVDQEISSDTFTYTTSDAPGMYIALVTPGEAGVIYNPIVVSSDFSATPNTSEIDASSAVMGTSTVAKKEIITVTKTDDEVTDDTENAHDVGDIVEFTITTKIPAYSNSYVNPKFTLSDSLSNGLVLVVDDDHPFTVECEDVTVDTTADNYVAAANEGTSFVLPFKSSEIAALVDYADVTVTYYAKITGAATTNVTEEENTVTVEFSNNPNEDDDVGTLKDRQTRLMPKA